MEINKTDPVNNSHGGSHFQRVAAKMRFVFKKYGWKLGILIFVGYLIRDSVLYIIIPYLVAKEIIAG
jgi:hypothetical protein